MTDATPEEWRPVIGYESTYEVSSLGRLRSLPRPGARGGLIKLIPTHDGYSRVTLAQGGQTRQQKVHRLVAAAFLGPCPPGLQVRHLDGDSTNNAVSNLRYGTRSQNILDEVTHGTHNEARKTHCPRGHEYSEQNTYRIPSRPNMRYCRTCNRDRRPGRVAS